MTKRLGKLAVLLLLLSVSLPAKAEPPQCRLPDRIKAAPCARSEAPRGQAGAFDFYVLSFSWSPAFCDSKAGARSPLQCRDNHFGWVVHGLWPQYAAGSGKRPSWPQYCRAVAPVPEPVLRQHLCSLPDPRLMQCEWAKHGSCSDFTESAAYFAAIERLRARFVLPIPEAGGAAGFAAALMAANPGLARRYFRIIRNGQHVRELQICLERDLDNVRSCRF